MQEILHLDPNDATRFVPLTIIKADGNPADTGVAGNTATLYINDDPANTKVTGPLVAVNATRGHYKAPLTLANITGMFPNDKGRVSYDDASTLPADGVFVIVPNPYAHIGTAAGGTVNTAVLQSTADATDGRYTGLVFESLEPVPFMRYITGYVGATKIVTFDQPAPSAPGVTTKYIIWKEAPPRDGAADLLATVPAGSTATLAQIFTKLGGIALDGSGQVTVGSIAGTALTLIVNAMQAAGTVLGRITSAITDKLALFAVDGAGAVTTSNPGGLTAGQVTTLNQIATDTADVKARVTVTITDKLGRLAVSVAGAVDASNVEASGLTTVQDDNLTLAAQNSNTLVTRVTQAIMDALARFDVGNDGAVKVGNYSITGQQVLGDLLDTHILAHQPTIPTPPTPTAIADAVETRKTVFADALLDRVDGVATGVTPRMKMRADWLLTGLGGKITGLTGVAGNVTASVFTPNGTLAATATADNFGNRAAPATWNLTALGTAANF